MKVNRALIIRRLKVPQSLEYAEACAKTCEQNNVSYEYIDGIEFMSSEEGFKAVGVWQHPNNIQKKVSQGNNNCHASHIKCWRRIVELNEACLILEHDCLVKGDVCNIDIIEDAINVFGHRITGSNYYTPISPIVEMVKIPDSIGGHAYSITPKTAQWFIEDAETNGVNINVDELINKRCGLPLYITDPTQVVCHPRVSTREWIEEDNKREMHGSTTTFGSAYTDRYKRGLKFTSGSPR
tara:strand:- start:5692 stop:6408 length:717 start_codon:yes stop_codon:yes gene_type:complete